MANPKFPLKRVHFGLVDPGAKLVFRIAPAKGFAVTAVLDCNLKVVASWEWVELKGGQKIEETLLPKGTYTLTLHIVYTGDVEATAEVDISVNTKKKPVQIGGKSPDIGRVLAVVFVE